MTAGTAASYDPSSAGPLRECGTCAPGHVTQMRQQYADDRAGRLAHAQAFGHYPRTTTEGAPS